MDQKIKFQTRVHIFTKYWWILQILYFTYSARCGVVVRWSLYYKFSTE